MNKSTTTERLVRIETKLCKFVESQDAANKAQAAQLRNMQKLLSEQKKENKRLQLFLDQWEEYQQKVNDGTIQDH